MHRVRKKEITISGTKTVTQPPNKSNFSPWTTYENNVVLENILFWLRGVSQLLLEKSVLNASRGWIFGRTKTNDQHHSIYSTLSSIIIQLCKYNRLELPYHHLFDHHLYSTSIQYLEKHLFRVVDMIYGSAPLFCQINLNRRCESEAYGKCLHILSHEINQSFRLYVTLFKIRIEMKLFF